MEKIFQLYGSASSQDVDVLIFEDELPNSIQECADLCKIYNDYFSSFFQTEKIINSNIAIVKNGIIVQVHKGVADELNNSIFLTYHFHKQYFPNQITQLVSRDVELKMIRCARVILSFLTRTVYRKKVKLALRGDFKDKIETLSQIDISQIQDFGKKQVDTDVLKRLAFQLGQTLALMEGVELFTKEDISDYLPVLTPFLKRESASLIIVQEIMQVFLAQSQQRIPIMKRTKE